jgi:hypothetical protein
LPYVMYRREPLPRRYPHVRAWRQPRWFTTTLTLIGSLAASDPRCTWSKIMKKFLQQCCAHGSRSIAYVSLFFFFFSLYNMLQTSLLSVLLLAASWNRHRGYTRIRSIWLT